MNTTPETLPAQTSKFRYAAIPLDRIESEAQVRTRFDPRELKRLGESLLIDGQIQPAIVFEEGGRFVVVAGERRLRAARMAGLPSLDCVVFPHRPRPCDATRLQLLENVLRRDLDPIDKAEGFRLLMEQEGLQAKQLAERLHLATSTVTRSLALLALPIDLQGEIRSGMLAPAIAREVARLPEEERRREVLARIKAEKLTSTQAAKLVAQLLKPRKAKPARKNRKTYKLAGYEAVMTPGRLLIAPTGAKRGRAPEDVLIALEQLLDRLREEIASRPALPAMPEPSLASIH
jgi:ParB family transcriptional regulator, chromosome partitioning protein